MVARRPLSRSVLPVVAALGVGVAACETRRAAVAATPSSSAIATPEPAPRPVATLPEAARFGAANLACSGSGGGDGTMRVADARRFVASAVVVADPNDGWSYAPWCSGTIAVDGVARALELYFGGRGRLATDGGSVVFAFDPELVVLSRATPARPTAP